MFSSDLTQYINEKGTIIFWFFTFPLAAVFVKDKLSRRTVMIALGGFIVLFIPLGYIHSGFYELLAYAIIVCMFVLLTPVLDWRTGIACSFMLLVPLLFVWGFFFSRGFTWYLYEKRDIVFWFFTFPLAGIFLKHKLASLTIEKTLVVLMLLFIPLGFGYYYFISWFYELVAYSILACLFALFSPSQRWLSGIGYSFVLLVPLLAAWFFFSFMGSITIERRWRIGRYKIEVLHDRPFAGRTARTYRLSRNAIIPLFVRTLEQDGNRDTEGNNCIIHYPQSQLTFDLCKAELIQQE